MPYKYPISKGWNIPKQKYKLSNWPEYNAALRQRGRIEVWISDEAIEQWYEKERVYDGTGTPRKYTDFAIIICHEIRKVFKLPLRQCQGFIDSLFEWQGLPIRCPDYTVLSRRLQALGLKNPRYRKNERMDGSIAAIAIDSTGLKRFGRDEWHQEKHHVSAKRSWRKLHIAVDTEHYIQAGMLTDRYVSDDSALESLVGQIQQNVDHVTADGAYDKNPVYEQLSHQFPEAMIVIPPSKNAVFSEDNHPLRNHHIVQIEALGRMQWQRDYRYGQRNYSELSIQRYKRILGPGMQARELSRQKQEAMIGCGVLNKMVGLGMPRSYRST
jgi:hypothetical protein